MYKLKEVTKVIKGITVLNNISYEFEQGKIYGLYGVNGSGKTMILRTLSGLVVPTKGKVEIGEMELHRDISFPPSVGLIIENMQLLPNLTAKENLWELSKIKKVATKTDIDNILKRVGLNTDKPVKTYSLGMRQRLNIAQALFEKPELILLDEPMNALDDNGIENVYTLLKEERNRGACVVIATHNKADFENLCDVILKVSEGKMEKM